MQTRWILEAVASGRLSPEEAAALLGTAGNGGGEAGAPPPPAGSRARLLRVQAAARAVRIVGDAAVAEVAVEGVHEVRREGDALVVSACRGDDEVPGGFAFVGPQLGRLARRAWRAHQSPGSTAQQGRGGQGARDWEDWTAWFAQGPGRSDWGEWQRLIEPLVVRVNPDLEVHAEATAAALTVADVRGRLVVDVSAGSATLDGVTGPLEVRAQAAAVRARARLAAGTSWIRCDAGNVSVRLQPGSDARVRATCELGRLRVGGVGDDWGDQGSRELVVGTGRATLDVEATMGAVDIWDETAPRTAGGHR
ncbi:MAG TPA: hypothetical protein VE152_05330 [Acidimicrobiales bacterium]|nr:hypothetical protein [Acidimicrobiales bacterium]